MVRVSRRVTVGVLSASVVAAMVGVSTWALAGETPAADGSVRLIVGTKLGADGAAPMRVASPFGARSMDAAAQGRHDLAVLRAQTIEVSKARSARVIASLKQDPNVSYVEVDNVRKATDVAPNDPWYTRRDQPEVDQVKLPAAWDTTTGSSAVKIAVLDTGVSKVGDLTGAVLGGYNYVSNTGNTADDFEYNDGDVHVHGHGTTVASLIAGRGNNGTGIAGGCWQCGIIPVKVLDSKGNGYDSTVAKGIVYATNVGAKIINMSLSGAQWSRVLSDAVAYANLKGVLVVAAAGNEGNTQKQYPAALADVVAVGATDYLSDEPAWFSSRNKPGDSWVDMAAPGIVAGMDRYGSYDVGHTGTSFAAPMVAGAAGLIKTVHPGYTAWSMQRALLVSARPIGGNGWSKYGMLDAAKALTISTDSALPTVKGISSPGQGWRVHGKITVTPTGVSDAWSGIRNVDLFADGVYKAQDRTSPYSLSYNTAGRNGPVKLQLRVYDKAGNRTTFDRTIIADNILPTVKITSGPKNKAKVSGTVKIGASASDANGVRRVEMLMNGKVIQTDTTAPYNFSFTASKQPKKMKVQIRAVDNAGNIKYDAARNYTR
jgi:thermitase